MNVVPQRMLPGGCWPPGALTRREIDWLLERGVSLSSLALPTPVRAVDGKRTASGRFEIGQGDRWWAIDEGDALEPIDTCFWSQRSPATAVDTARAFCLSGHLIEDPATYALDGRLKVFCSPLDWLIGRRLGIFVLDWTRAFNELRDCPRIDLAKPA